MIDWKEIAIRERAAALKQYDDLCPEVGMGFMGSYYKEAKEALEKEHETSNRN